jgi:hypothetical protein
MTTRNKTDFLRSGQDIKAGLMDMNQKQGYCGNTTHITGSARRHHKTGALEMPAGVEEAMGPVYKLGQETLEEDHSDL